MLTPGHIETYCKIMADPAYRAGYRVDAAVDFCERVERRLRVLTPESRRLALLQAMGYSQLDMARMQGVALRTVARRMRAVNAVLFRELSGWIGPVRVKRAPKTLVRRQEAA